MSKKKSRKYSNSLSFLIDCGTSAQCHQYLYDLKWSDGYSTEHLKKAMDRTVDSTAVVTAEDWKAYQTAMSGRTHITLHSSKLTNFENLHWYIFNLKNWIKGILHHVSRAHMARYLCKHNYRFNNRNYTGDSFLRYLNDITKIPPLPRQMTVEE